MMIETMATVLLEGVETGKGKEEETCLLREKVTKGDLQAHTTWRGVVQTMAIVRREAAPTMAMAENLMLEAVLIMEEMIAPLMEDTAGFD